MDREEIKLRDPERAYVRLYIDFIDSTLLSIQEKVIFLVLKRFLSYRNDWDEDTGIIYPSRSEIARLAGSSIAVVSRTIASLLEKGIMHYEGRTEEGVNRYSLADRSYMWKAKNLEELKIFATETEETRSLRLIKEAGYQVRRKVIRGTGPHPSGIDWENPAEEIPPGTIGVVDRDAHPLYVKIYHDTLESGMLTLSELGMFATLKRFVDVSRDINGISQTVYPSLQTISSHIQLTQKTVIKIIDQLCEKGILEKKQRGRRKTNLYILSDRTEMWKAKDFDEVKKRAQENDVEKAARILREKGYTIIQPEEHQERRQTAKKTASAPERGSMPSPTQTEYTTQYLREELGVNLYLQVLKEHGALSPGEERLVNIIVNVIRDTLNSTQKTYKIQGVVVPAADVRDVFLKLNYGAIRYTMKQYKSVTHEIKTPTSYIRSILYQAGIGDYDLSEINSDMVDLYKMGKIMRE